ncbi:MAG: hypothetical protein WCR42_16085 [bacterium]
MKKNIFEIALIICILLLAQSCKKDQVLNPDANTINVPIQAGLTYEYDLGYFGDEEGAHISQQATHFQISEIGREFGTGKVIYTYKSTENYIGTDEVEITSERGSDGASPNDHIIITKINFTITK